MGFSGGLPLSLQVVGKPFDESTVFKAAEAYQTATDWHLHIPPLLTEFESSYAGEPV
jgi:aspartyl-tRNA(Asn)/glutamyl-tRNA(Gln) amidotransferase subunit A